MQRISSARIKVAFWVAFLAVQMIWGAPSNSIDRVVAKFSTDSTWDGGLFVPIFMPPNTPSIEVAKQALKNDYPVTATNFTIVEVRQIGISRGEEPLPEEYAQLDPKMARDLKAFYARTNYTAVLFRAAAGERIVMVQFQPLEDPRDRPGFWWNRVYDPKRLLPQSETREYK